MNDISKNLIADIKSLIAQGRQVAYSSVNTSMIDTYWQIGRRIVEEEQKGEQRAAYGDQLIAALAHELTASCGNVFSARYLRAFRQFYLFFPSIKIWKSRFPNLTWTHIFHTLRVGDANAASYSILKGNEQLFAAKYKLYMPTEDELRNEIERQKDLFRMQRGLPDNYKNK